MSKQKIFHFVASVAVLLLAIGFRLSQEMLTAAAHIPAMPFEAVTETELLDATTTTSLFTTIQQEIQHWKQQIISASAEYSLRTATEKTTPHPTPVAQETTMPAAPAAPGVHVPILIYHSTRFLRRNESRANIYLDVSPNIFEQQMAYLSEHGYANISFDQLTEAIAGKTRLPEKSVIISFDDGWRNQYREAFPILKKYGMSATFFVWTDAISRLPNFMTWEELREMDAAGMRIESHSLTHPMLSRIRDEAVLRRQIFDSKKIIEEKLGKPVTVFAYPYGLINSRVEKLVQEAGYTSARGVSRGATHAMTDLFALHAFTVTGNMEQFKKILQKM